MSNRYIRTTFFAVMMVLCMSALSSAQVGVFVSFGPPALPVYEQPLCPGDGYLWTPGYWAWDGDVDDYYWVPGTWVMAPEVGFLWTPPYWGWGGEGFIFHEGWWGPQVGFYGGIDYGFGYFGTGFEGGRWDGGHFFYNRAVMNVNVTEIHNVYNTRVEINNNSHVSYNGGNGGIDARPRPQEEAAAREHHLPPVAAQSQHMQQARGNPQLRASENRGKPAIAATARPADFRGGVVQAREAGGTYTPPANRGGNQARGENRGAGNTPAEGRTENNATRSTNPGHVRDLPPAERPAAPNTGNTKKDQKYQQQMEKQYTKQNQERQKLAQKQDNEDQRVAKQNNDARKQQMEQQHQQQTQQLQQRHQQQQQQMQQRIQPRPHSEPNRSKPPR